MKLLRTWGVFESFCNHLLSRKRNKYPLHAINYARKIELNLSADARIERKHQKFFELPIAFRAEIGCLGRIYVIQ